jgi:Mrp family chromosome partitioning ATPase
VDADFHQSNLNERLGLAPHDGLAECLTRGLDPLSAICRLEPLGWYLLPTGETPTNPTALLHDDSAFAPIRRLSQAFDWIIIDAPPVLPLTDAISLRQQSDATLLVARAGVTPVKAIRDSIALLGPKSVMGIILNGIEGQDELYSKYKGYYAAAEPKGNSGAS